MARYINQQQGIEEDDYIELQDGKSTEDVRPALTEGRSVSQSKPRQETNERNFGYETPLRHTNVRQTATMNDGGYIDLGNVQSQQQATSSNSSTAAERPEIYR